MKKLLNYIDFKPFCIINFQNYDSQTYEKTKFSEFLKFCFINLQVMHLISNMLTNIK